jgi:protein tyrosine phosphatase (PTP) superfamily phosphohydrolase (DUF442 family)
MSSRGVEQILNYRRIAENIGTAGQPTADQFADIRASGYQVVINLAMSDSTNALPNEAELVAEQGMEYIHIPVAWEGPRDDDLDRFFDLMTRYQGRKVFVHCALNWRVSSFMLLYRVIHQGIPVELAKQALSEVWTLDMIWHGFIRRSLTRYGIPASSESEI